MNRVLTDSKIEYSVITAEDKRTKIEKEKHNNHGRTFPVCQNLRVASGEKSKINNKNNTSMQL